jgi:hypothetical protein
MRVRLHVVPPSRLIRHAVRQTPVENAGAQGLAPPPAPGKNGAVRSLAGEMVRRCAGRGAPGLFSCASVRASLRRQQPSDAVGLPS